jgi:hypothetical protein
VVTACDHRARIGQSVRVVLHSPEPGERTANDYKDVEQLYLYVNWRSQEQRSGVHSPSTLLHVRFPPRDVVDEIGNMLPEGHVEAQYSNDETRKSAKTLGNSIPHKMSESELWP